MKKIDPQKYEKFMKAATKVGKVVAKCALAIGSMAILNAINNELGQFGVKVDYDGNDIHVETGKKEEKKTPAPEQKQKPKHIDELSWERTPQVVAIISLTESANNSYSNSVKTDAATKIFDIAANGDATAIECAICQLGSIAKKTYSNSVKEYCSELIGKLGVLAGDLGREEAKVVDDKASEGSKDRDNDIREKEEDNHE